MKKILFIHQSSDLYGSDKTLLLLLTHLDREQFLPVVILPSEGPLKTELEKLNLKVVIAPVLKLHRQLFTVKNSIRFTKEVRKGISVLDELHKQYQFDIIYSNTLAVLLGMIYARKRKIKHIWHVHEIIVHPKIIAALFPRLLNKYADVVVCNSKATMKNLIDRQKGIEKKAVLIYNGIENKTPTTIASKKDFGFDDEDIVITLVGRINRLKGHKLLLDAFKKQLAHHPHVKLLFIGSPFEGQDYYLEEIQKIIAESDLQQKVTIRSFTKDLAPIWSVTDIAVMPSTEAESFGLVAVEAMMAKKPVVGSDHGGLSEIILHKETGFLVAPNNADALADALAQLIENPDLRKTFGQAGHQRVIETFSEEKYVSGFESLFLKILN